MLILKSLLCSETDLLTELVSSDLAEQMLKAFWKFWGFLHVVNENYLF